MNQALSPARQRTAVSEGFAFGLLTCGHDSLRFRGVGIASVGSALEEAWRGWTHKAVFPQVTSDLGNASSAVYVFTQTDERTPSTWFFWDGFAVSERPHVSTMDDLDVDEIAATIGGGVPAPAWHYLAKDMLDLIGVPEVDD